MIEVPLDLDQTVNPCPRLPHARPESINKERNLYPVINCRSGGGERSGDMTTITAALSLSSNKTAMRK